MIVKVIVKVDDILRIVNEMSRINRDKNHDCYGKTGFQQIIESWSRRGDTEIDLAMMTYEAKPIVRVEINNA